MRCLITGGAGFIGSHIARAYASLGAKVVVFDDLSTGTLANLATIPHTFVYGSILNSSLLFAAMHSVDVVYHFAACSNISYCESFPYAATRVNVLGTRNVLDAATRRSIPRVLFSSSAAIYSPFHPSPYSELHPAFPVNVYGRSKLQGEALCFLYGLRAHSPKITIMRFFNVYGPHSLVSSSAAVIPRFLCQALRGSPLTIHGPGHHTRDFLYITDLVSACLAIASLSSSAPMYNVGSGRSTSLASLAQSVLRITRSTSPIVHLPPSPSTVLQSSACIRRLCAATSWRPTMSLRRGLTALTSSLTSCERSMP